ncbi:MAG: Do family serine endopeptidase [Thermodesulfobacteriota bacterium]
MNRFVVAARGAALLVASVAPAARAALPQSPRETPVVLAVRKASPAVVNISTETVVRTQSPFRGFSPFFDDFFRDFFGELPGQERRQQGLGSGVLIRPEGIVLTNEHVIQSASRILVTLASGEEFEASLVGADSRTDLAVLRVEAQAPLPHLPMGTSADLMIGETVIAIGNPFGLSHTVTTGVVSALDRTIRGANDRVYADFIQTDASINPGNSGGPLLNLLGELVGINSAIYQRAEGIGFAIPIDKARRIVESLLAYGRVYRAWLGLHVQDLSPELARHFGVAGRSGVLVTRVFEESPAQRAGLRRGDVLLELDGTALADRDGFFERLAGYTVGSRLRFRVAREGGERTVEVEAREIPPGYAQALSETWLGLTVEENSAALARRHGLATNRGLVVTQVLRGSAAAAAGIEPGDVLRQVNSAPVDTADQYREALLAASQRETVVLLVQRGRAGYYVSLTP